MIIITSYNRPALTLFEQLDKSSPLLIVNATIYQLEPVLNPRLNLLFPRLDGTVNNYYRTFEIKFRQWFIENFFLQLGVSWEFVSPCLVRILKYRFEELSNMSGASGHPGCEISGSELSTLEDAVEIETRIRKYLNTLLTKHMSFVDLKAFFNVWVEDQMVYPFRPDSQIKIERAFTHIEHSLYSAAPGLKEYLDERYAMWAHRIKALFGMDKLFKDECAVKTLATHSNNIREICLKLKYDIIDNFRGISVKEFENQFSTKIDNLVKILSARIDQSGEVLSWKRKLQYYNRKYFDENAAKEQKNFKCGAFELRILTDGIILAGMHTGRFILEDYGAASPVYYLFPDAYVAVAIRHENIMSQTVPTPLIVNNYSHPFLQLHNGKMQYICLGDTSLYELTGKESSYTDRVLNTIFMAVKVIREGHHNLNGNSYHHQLSEAIFKELRLPRNSLSNFKDIPVFKYLKGDNGNKFFRNEVFDGNIPF